jgi:RNA polymerase-binding protein DksA
MATLTSEQKARLKEKLQSRERELYEDTHREVGKFETYERLAGEAPDPGDASTADTIIDTNRAEVGRDIAELRAIGAALQRINSPDFGSCIDCGVDVPYERLLAQPAAQRCLQCQQLYEHNHAGAGRPPSL